MAVSVNGPKLGLNLGMAALTILKGTDPPCSCPPYLNRNAQVHQ